MPFYPTASTQSLELHVGLFFTEVRSEALTLDTCLEVYSTPGSEN